MFNEKVFNADIENIKHDLAMEGMEISEQDVSLFRRFANNEINMPELINLIKNQPAKE